MSYAADPSPSPSPGVPHMDAATEAGIARQFVDGPEIAAMFGSAAAMFTAAELSGDLDSETAADLQEIAAGLNEIRRLAVGMTQTARRIDARLMEERAARSVRPS